MIGAGTVAVNVPNRADEYMGCIACLTFDWSKARSELPS
jgi:hypothetical protein